MFIEEENFNRKFARTEENTGTFLLTGMQFLYTLHTVRLTYGIIWVTLVR